MKYTIALLATLFVVSLNLSAAGEMRIWTDENGKTIEAEHVRTLNDKVILKLADGSEIKVSLNTLKEKDRRYAILLAPPRVEIKVSIKNERDNKAVGPSNYGPGVQIQKESVQASVNIKKTSSAPYEAPMMSAVYLIGTPENSEAYVILDQTKSRFTFSTENKNEHSYKSGVINLKQIEAGRQAGLEYEGYIAVVRDRTGEIISMKCSKLAFEKHADAIIGSDKGTVFDNEFNKMDKEEVKRAVEEKRGKIHKKRFPGRRF